jgi:3-oxoacyl-[acyl-carrier-protein] synthase II
VGDGACAIVLESSEHVARRSDKTYARYLGGAFAHQAWKQTIPDVRAGLLGDVIQSALVRTKVSWPDVDLIAPHGASTLLSDGYERDCLATAIDASGVKTGAAACAFKPYIGHMLAASGVIEVAALLLCMKHGRVPAMPNSAHGTCTLPVFAPTSVTERPIGIALKLSTGFTGHDAAALFASV